jgi:hypothetical protein
MISSGEALKWWQSEAEKRWKQGLPSPPWMAPYVRYQPYWWIVPNQVQSNGGNGLFFQESNVLPGTYNPLPPAGSGSWRPVLLLPLTHADTADKIIKILSAVSLSIMGGAMLSAAMAGLWTAIGAPSSAVLTDGLAAGIKAEIGGGDFLDAATSAILPGAGEIVSDLGGSELLSTVADVAAGNIEPQDLAMGIFDNLTGGLDFIDEAVGDASSFLDDVLGLGQQVADLGSLFGGGDGGNGFPGPPPIFDPGEAAGLGTPATPEQVAAWEASASTAFPVLPALVLAWVVWG